MTDIEDSSMFCFQCEQTFEGKGCISEKGVCGKTPEVAALQDLLVEVIKKIATYASLASTVGYVNKATDIWILDALFATLTNVNFDEKRMDEYLREGALKLKAVQVAYAEACAKKGTHPKGVKNGDWEYKPNLKTLIEEGRMFILTKEPEDINVKSTKQLTLYGLKGCAAYLHHAMRLGFEDDAIYDMLNSILYKITTNLTFEEAIGVSLKAGELGYKILEILDKANTTSYGHPEPTTVRTTPLKGKCLLVSGHDLKDLELVLKQSAGKGINVYTHGEMLPCNAYPKLKGYKHLVGHYGGPWQNQKVDFNNFPGPILMTTNCIIEPRKTYINRIFTRCAVGWPGVTHIPKDDMSVVIESALKEPGFTADAPKKELVIGFAHHTVLSLAGVIVDAVKKGAIKHFFLIGGCDGTESERSYFSDFAKAVPKDCIVITLGCGKYRLTGIDFGAIEFEGKKIPRLLDAGQCNDSFSAIQIAVALAGAFKCTVNELPLSLVISWFEQKAVCVFLTLLHLGIKNIVLGPRLPAFVTPKLLGILVEKFAVRPIGTVEADMKYLMSKKA